MRAPKSSESADNPTGPPTLDDQCPTTAGFPPKSNPTYGIVNQDTAASDTWYNALQVKWTKRFSHGLSGGITYTWAKMLDYGSGQQGVEAAVGEAVLFPQVRFLDKGIGGFSIANNFKANVMYRVPALTNFQGRIANALNGWWIAGIVSMQSGLPLNPIIGNRSLSNNPAAAGTANDRPNLDPSFNRATVITHNPKLSIRIVVVAGYKFNRRANHVHHYDIKANPIFAEADFLVRGNSHKKGTKFAKDFL